MAEVGLLKEQLGVETAARIQVQVGDCDPPQHDETHAAVAEVKLVKEQLGVETAARIQVQVGESDPLNMMRRTLLWLR